MTTPAIPTLCLAQFQRVVRNDRREPVLTVHFNPETLQYTVSNTLRAEGSGTRVRQFVDKADPKLTMQLVFDTTDTGVDVRQHTGKLARLVNPFDEAQQATGVRDATRCGAKLKVKDKVPPNVEFSWGNFVFIGLIESFKETLDYFSANGVPLRAVVDIAMLGQQPTLGSRSASTGGDPGAGAGSAADTPEAPVVSAAGGPAAAASRLGAPEASRDIARANGASSLRGDSGSAGGALALPQTPALARETAFSTGAPSRGAAGLSLGAGVGIGVGVGIGAAAGRGAGLDLGATAGAAFGGLRTRVELPSPLPESDALLGSSASFGASVGVGAGAGAGFGIGGAASSGGGAGPCTEVGSAADLARLVRFD